MSIPAARHAGQSALSKGLLYDRPRMGRLGDSILPGRYQELRYIIPFFPIAPSPPPGSGSGSATTLPEQLLARSLREFTMYYTASSSTYTQLSAASFLSGTYAFTRFNSVPSLVATFGIGGIMALSSMRIKDGMDWGLEGAAGECLSCWLVG